ncbi:MAG: hypothetical protein ACRD1X_11905 [Vicinamibacteria bacterium]
MNMLAGWVGVGRDELSTEPESDLSLSTLEPIGAGPSADGV